MGFYNHLFVVPKSSGGLKTRFRRKCSKCLCQKDIIQDGNKPFDPCIHSPGRMDGVHQHAGRVLSHSSTSNFEKVPQVYVSGQGVPISGSLLRLLNSAASVHQNIDSPSKMASFDGDKDLLISRQLATTFPLQSAMYGGHSHDSSLGLRIGPSHQSRQVLPDAFSGDSLFRDDNNFSGFSGFSSPEENRKVSQPISG